MPHISASLPSALNMRMRASACSDGQIRIRPSRADAEMPVADRPTQAGGIGRHRFVEAIDVDVIVAGTLHFGETHTRFQANNERARQVAIINGKGTFRQSQRKNKDAACGFA